MDWIEIEKLKPHPKNPNTHSDEQIKRLSELIQYQGWRHPIIVSENSGYIVAGHGRLSAAKLLKLPTVPVVHQSFLSEEQEYAFLVSDNSIASWAELNLAQINAEIPTLGPDFNIEHLGLQNFLLEPADKFTNQEHWSELPDMDREQDNYKIVVTLYNEKNVNELLTIINGSDVKRFRDGRLTSLVWPKVE